VNWSAIAWWGGLRFDDLLRAYPPMSQAKWVRLESSVNRGPWGNPDPYFVSLDLSTARHPQTLLATHLNGKPLTVEHGAPLRLVAPVKLGLKNIKAITRINLYVRRASGLLGKACQGSGSGAREHFNKIYRKPTFHPRTS